MQIFWTENFPWKASSGQAEVGSCT